ncbi:MAG: acetolactate synthase small subunit [Balneolales bacterium]
MALTKMDPEEKTYTISLRVAQGFNALSRIVGLFSGRGFNIDSISFGDAEKPEYARVTITTHGDRRIIDQIILQLDKLVDVLNVEDLTYIPHMERELALIKVSSNPRNQSEIIQVINVFRGNVIDITPDSLTIEVTGRNNKVDATISMLRRFGLLEVARTGTVALKREYQDSIYSNANEE